MVPSLIVSLFAAGWLAQQPAQVQGKPISANLKVRIATSTYMPDGRVLTTSASDWPLKLNEAVVAYASSGKSLCEPKPASSQQPEFPALGWRLEITPIRESAGELEVRVQWRSLGFGLAGLYFARANASGVKTDSSTTLTLHAGDRIVLDYVTGTGTQGRFRTNAKLGDQAFRVRKEAIGAAAESAPACKAVGMSLEVGLEPAKTDAVVEAELWLVRGNRDGTERVDRQVLRVPVGQPASRYFFDEARLADQTAATGFAKVSGELSVLALENGRIRFNFNVMRKSARSTSADTSSSFRDLTAAIGEVVAFKLPPDDPRTDLPLSIRLRANLLR